MFDYLIWISDLNSRYFGREKVSIDNSLWISIDTPFKISIDRAIAVSIDTSSRKLYGRVWFVFSNSLDQLSSVSSQLDHSSYFQVLSQAMAWSQLILRSKFKGWPILNLAVSITRWKNNWYHSNYPKEWFVLSQIRGRVVILRDRIHRDLGNLRILIWFVKQRCFKSFKSKL